VKKQILAAYDQEGIYVYQAFKPSIVESALDTGTFNKGFSLDRMTWIKPSFGWMLYRSGYATKKRQEAIVRVKLSHEGFLEMLSDAVPTSFESDIFETRDEWQLALKHSKARYQWDPERDLAIRRQEERALQLGIRGDLVRRYVSDWILGLEEITPLARDIHALIKQGVKDTPSIQQAIAKMYVGDALLEEKPYPVPEDIQKQLGIQ